MKSLELPSGRGPAELGAGRPALGAAPQSAEGRDAGGQTTHGENSDLPGGEPRDLGPGDMAAIFGGRQEAVDQYPLSDPARSATALKRLEDQGVTVEENPEAMGGGERQDDEIAFVREWRRLCVAQGPSKLRANIAWVENQVEQVRLSKGKKPDLFEFKISKDGATQAVAGTYQEALSQLRLALMVYQTPEEAARSLRHRWPMVLYEIEEHQQFEAAKASDASNRFATKDDGQDITVKEYSAHLDQVYEFIEKPPEVELYRQEISQKKEAYGDRYIQRIAERLRRYQIVGLAPDQKDLPPYVPLDQALSVLRANVPHDLDMEDFEAVQNFMLAEQRKRQAEMMKEMGMGIGQEAMGGEAYLQMYQKAWNEFIRALESFPSEIQDEIVINYIIGGSILGGQFAQFFRKAVEQYGDGPKKWSQWLGAIEFIGKVGGMKGYLPMEHVFQSIGSTPQEVVAFPDFHQSNHEVLLEGEEKPRNFSLSTREVIGHFSRLGILSRLGTTNAFTPKEGFNATVVGEFFFYTLRKMGYPPEQAKAMAFEGAPLPDFIRDRWLSPIRRCEVDKLGTWGGEVALDKLVAGLAFIKWAGIDFEFAPWDMGRRELLSGRGLFLSAYKIGYAMGLPPEQFWSMIAVFGSAVSVDRKKMFGWVKKRMGEARGSSPEEEKLAKLRQKIWEATTILQRPSLASSQALARMAMGIGKFNKDKGSEYREALNDGLQRIPRASVSALRHPDLWKWRWFKGCSENWLEDDPSKWQFVGVDGITEKQARDAFANYDFTDELLACGLPPSEVSSLPHKGFDGWKRLLNEATMGLVKWMDVSGTLGDKIIRYRKKQADAQDATVTFWDTSHPNVSEELNTSGGVASDVGMLADIKGSVPSYEVIGETRDVNVQSGFGYNLQTALTEALSKIVKPTSEALGFVTNSTQQAYLEAVVSRWADGHIAIGLDSYVEDIDLEGEREEEFQGGVAWAVKLLRRGDPEFVQHPERVEALMSQGFYFHVLPESNDRSKDPLISPLQEPVPRLIKAQDLLKNLKEKLKSPTVQDWDHAAQVLSAISLMEDKGLFCWDLLVNGRLDIPPVAMIGALNSLREEGTLTASAKKRMVNELLRRYKLLPSSLQPKDIDGGNETRLSSPLLGQ